MQAMRILLVDDSPTDAKLTALWLRENKLVESTTIVEDGDAALAFLRDAASDKPDVVLLDINLPRRSGFSILEELKSDHHLAHLPVIMLTGTLAPDVIQRAESLRAEMCLIKPGDAEEFIAMAERIVRFWRSRNSAGSRQE